MKSLQTNKQSVRQKNNDPSDFSRPHMVISQRRWSVFSRTLNNTSNVNQTSKPELPVLACLWFYITWDNTDQKSHHVGQKHVGGDGQKEAHEDKDHGQERHPQGQDTEPTGAADPVVS